MKSLNHAVITGSLLLGSSLFPLNSSCGQTSNGNDFALYYSEARTPQDKADLFNDAKGRPHFFRYLTIQTMAKPEAEAVLGVSIKTVEPASEMVVAFTVTAPVSLSRLSEDPESKPGNAIAVTGRVTAVDPETNTIHLEQSIVRHKDRTSPKVGREVLSEVDPRAVVYTYTDGPRPVQVQERDKDLLEHRDRILEEKGPVAWVEFLEQEIRKRNEERAKEAVRPQGVSE